MSSTSVRRPRSVAKLQVVCPHHPDANLIEDYHAGDMICPECGLVVGDRVIDVGSEWRTFSNENGGDHKDQSRVGAAEHWLLGSDLFTMIGPGGKQLDDESGKPIYTNRGSMNSSTRTLTRAFGTISGMSDRLNLPGIITDRAKKLFKMVHEGKNLKGHSSEVISSACLYIACRQEEVPRTFKEIVAVSNHNKKEIGRVFMKIKNKLEIILKTPNANNDHLEIIESGDFISRFCGNLQLSREIQRAATTIAKRAVDFDLVPGRTPISIAATSIFMASQNSTNKKTFKEISIVAGVGEATIKKCYNLILPRAVELFPENLKFFFSEENSQTIEQLPYF